MNHKMKNRPTTRMNNTGTRGSTFSLGVSWVVEESEDSQLLGIMGGDTVTLALGTCSFIKNIRLWFLRKSVQNDSSKGMKVKYQNIRKVVLHGASAKIKPLNNHLLFSNQKEDCGASVQDDSSHNANVMSLQIVNSLQ